jgi:sugar O-acyltransferase (sialic acid O-acetyltransferase NeuD family)
VKPLFIYGASHFGEEIAQLFRDVNGVGGGWDIQGFLDDNQRKWGKERMGLPVLGGTEWLRENNPPESHAVIAIGYPAARKQVALRVGEIGVEFATAIHPTVITPSSNTFGKGCMVMAGSIFTINIRVGDHVIFNPGCTVGHNTTFGDYCTINPSAAIAGDVVLEEGVYVGIGASVSDKLEIGRGAIIGGGTMVIESIEAFATSVGVPSRTIKTRENDLD